MEEKPLIYSAEDDESIRELLECTVEASGYRIKTFETAEDLLSCMAAKAPDLVLLDIMLPGMDGMEALENIRSKYGALPVILVSAKGSELNKVKGLDSGADDYIAKPFGVLELVARIRARLKSASKEELSIGGIVLNGKKYTAALNGVKLTLTAKEFDLLKTLMENAGNVMKRDDLLNKVWGYEFMGETRTLDMHIMSLRAKLGGGEGYISTVRGVGYVFNQ